jgi:glycosyltransferase involved in cell wall biosynthesis
MNSALLVNGRFLDRAPTGVQRHAWEVLCRLLDTDLRPKVVVPRDLEIAAGYGPVPAGQLVRMGQGHGYFWQQTHLARRVGRRLLWTPSGLGPAGVRHQVLTLHDLAMLDHPEWFSRSYTMLYQLFLPAIARAALHIFTSSEFSRRRLIARLGVAPARISVVSSAVKPELCDPALVTPEAVAAVRQRYDLPPRYVLAVGSMDPRKNLRGLAIAMQQVQSTDPDLALVLVGGQRAIFGDARLADVAPPQVRALGYVPDADLPALYASAEVFAYPSLYEGFGIPPLEAMAWGTPVVTANSTSLPEVVGAAAVLVAPEDPAAIAAGLRQVLTDDDLRARLRLAGRQQAARYSWDTAAEQVGTVLRRLVQSVARPAQEPI